MISSQVVVECVANLIRKAGCPLAQIRVHVNDLLSVCEIVNRDESVILRAVDLFASGSWTWWDALIVAAALEASCDELWSEDLQEGRVVDGRLKIVNPLLNEKDSHRV